MKYKSVMAVLSVMLLVILSGCRVFGEDFKIKVINLTGVEISQIYIAPETDKGNMKNYLEENLPADGDVELSLGRLSDEDAEKGFTFEVFSAEDNSSESFGMLMIENGGTVSFYIDDFGLAVGVDMTEQEIEEQKQRDHENAL